MSMNFSNYCICDGADVEYIMMIELTSQFSSIYILVESFENFLQFIYLSL